MEMDEEAEEGLPDIQLDEADLNALNEDFSDTDENDDDDDDDDNKDEKCGVLQNMVHSFNITNTSMTSTAKDTLPRINNNLSRNSNNSIDVERRGIPKTRKSHKGNKDTFSWNKKNRQPWKLSHSSSAGGVDNEGLKGAGVGGYRGVDVRGGGVEFGVGGVGDGDNFGTGGGGDGSNCSDSKIGDGGGSDNDSKKNTKVSRPHGVQSRHSSMDSHDDLDLSNCAGH